jgi:uncharacterized protein involved in outer membrane biogenesis
MKKALLAITVVVLVGIAGGAYWLYSSLDSLVASAIRQYGPEITGVSVKLTSVKIKPADGIATLNGLVIGTPKDFKASHALALGEISMALDINSLTKDVIIIKEIQIIKPDVSYEYTSHGTNLDVIQRNIDNYLSKTLGGKTEPKEKGPGKKMIIDHLYVKEGKINFSADMLKGKDVPVPLPNLHLTDIGKKSNGATAAEVTKQILGAITQSATRAVSSINVGSLVEGAKESVGGKIKGLFK